MRMTTPQRVLAIVGGAFLIGTVQAVAFGPIVLKPANITDGVEDVKGDPNRINPITPEVPLPVIDDVDALEDAVQDAIADDIPEDVLDGIVPRDPTATFAGTVDELLDAPVPEGSLTLREAHQLWEMGAYFLDARHEHEFEAGHIEYASYLEASLFDTDGKRAFAVTDSIPTDATIVFYCLGGECDASKNTAALLEQLGYTDLRIMGAGYDDWVAAGFPIVTGAEEVSP